MCSLILRYVRLVLGVGRIEECVELAGSYYFVEQNFDIDSIN